MGFVETTNTRIERASTYPARFEILNGKSFLKREFESSINTLQSWQKGELFLFPSI